MSNQTTKIVINRSTITVLENLKNRVETIGDAKAIDLTIKALKEYTIEDEHRNVEIKTYHYQ